MPRAEAMSRKAVAAWACLLACASWPAQAGGPLILRATGQPYVWGAGVIGYRTDNGPLSASVDEATARGRVAAMFNVWEAVPTSNIAYQRATTDGGNGAGFINPTGAFAGGDVDTPAEYAAVDASCSNAQQNPVVYDADGSLIADLGMDNTSVIGFAGPCTVNASNILGGLVVMNGLFQDGASAPVPDLSTAEYDAAFIHEFGHFSGLDHSQVNANCLAPCPNDDLAGLPTMFPFLVHVSQGSLSVDDIAWISRLYPETAGVTTFAGTHGTISGVVFFSDGESHAQFVNVIARQVDTGANQDRTTAVSVISGYRFRTIHGNSVTGAGPSPFGSTLAGDIGLFEIPVPVGSYTVEVESIHPQFIDSSSIGSYQIAMPGTAPPPLGPVIVGAGVTSGGNNVVLIGTPARFDQFEGP